MKLHPLISFTLVELACSGFGCALEAETNDNTETDTDEITVLASRADERVPAFGLQFGDFPTELDDKILQLGHSLMEPDDNIHGNVRYARVNIAFEPDMIYPPEITTYDADIESAARHGIFILPTIVFPPSGIPDDKLINLEGFTKLLAKRYGPHGSFWTVPRDKPVPLRPIQAWEIGNEENSLNPVFSVGTASQYRDILRAARKGFRAGDRRARIVLGGLSSGQNSSSVRESLHFLDQIFEAKEHGKENEPTPVKKMSDRCMVDAIAYHPYGSTPDVALQLAEDFERRMEKLGLTGKNPKTDVHFWITEIGWGIDNSGLSGPTVGNEAIQDKYINKFAEKIKPMRSKWRLGPTIWYSFIDVLAYQEMSPPSWAGYAGIYGSKDSIVDARPAWDSINQIAEDKSGKDMMTVELPPVRCP